MCLLILLFKILKWTIVFLLKCLCFICPPIRLIWNCLSRIHWMRYVGFITGYFLGQLYYECLLKKVSFPDYLALGLNLGLSFILAIGNAICRQLRCISLLFVPMYCGKPGRGVLKAVVLTYVIAGPITNMGYNAKEVVRVFVCSTELAYNLSITKYNLMKEPFKGSILGLKTDMNDVKDTLRSIRNAAAPIEREMLDNGELNISGRINDYMDSIFTYERRSDLIDVKYKAQPEDSEAYSYQKLHLKKLEYRCQDQLSTAVLLCIQAFQGLYESCLEQIPVFASWAVCWPLKITYACNLMHLVKASSLCNYLEEANLGLGEGYVSFEKAKEEIIAGFNDVKLQYKVDRVVTLFDVQDAKETGERIIHAFEEKHAIMQKAVDIVNVCVALLFLRIVIAAGTYHDLYLTNIGYDNVYITSYFKRIDKRRKNNNECHLLPLKKMERSKYIDVHSFAYRAERSKLVTQILKVMLEMITATTFVMLDRLFYEALDVVRQHAEADVYQDGEHRISIEVDGVGVFARVVRRVLSGQGLKRIHRRETNQHCLPRPRAVPPTFYLSIYGGYLWILVLLYFNPYTLRLKRLICSWFYPKREKQRILHLYNDILKKRIKMQKTLQKKAVQAISAHYLTGENLLSLRLRFPELLGWLKVFPVARKACLICGEREPRNPKRYRWHTCSSKDCPFVYCGECWLEGGGRCLACHPSPSRAGLSDIDSLSDDEQPRY